MAGFYQPALQCDNSTVWRFLGRVWVGLTTRRGAGRAAAPFTLSYTRLSRLAVGLRGFVTETFGEADYSASKDYLAWTVFSHNNAMNNRIGKSRYE